MGALLVVGALVAWRLPVTTSITRFLTSEDELRQARVAELLAEGELTRTLVLIVDGPAATAAARDLAGRLAALPQVARVTSGVAADLGQELQETYFPRRLGLLSLDPEAELPGRLSRDGLRQAAAELKRRLREPTSTWLTRIAPRDPLLAFPARLEALERARDGTLRLVDGQLVTPDGGAVVLVTARGSPFDTALQRPLLAGLERAWREVEAAHPGPLRLERAGVHLLAQASERSIRRDVTRISALSTGGIVLIFLALFRHPGHLLAGLIPLLAGVVAAGAAALLLLGGLHGITLAFGATLLGICIDYPVHLINHHLLDPEPGGASATLRRVWPGLLLGAVTTVAGFAGLALTSFPGIRELALFASVGILAALLATRSLVPPLLPRTRSTRLQERLAESLARGLRAARSRPGLLAAPALAALVLAGLGLPRARWVDDISVLHRPEAALQAEQERVRERVARVDGARFVLALGPDLETALERGEAAAARLRRACADGQLESFRSLQALLPSRALQERNLARLRAEPELPSRLSEAFAAEGFRPGAFAPFLADLAAPPPPLTRADLPPGLDRLVAPFVLQLEDEVGVLTFLRGVRDAPALAASLEGLPGVRLFDQRGFLSTTYGRYREQVLLLVSLGLLAVLGLLLARYRRLRPALAAFLPAALAGAATLGTLALCGQPLHLLHLVALLLVLSMGVDYGVFLAEAAQQERPRAVPATVLSLGVACATTVCAFGLLALSDEPALEAIGLTSGLGVLWSLLLAPSAHLLLVGRPAAWAAPLALLLVGCAGTPPPEPVEPYPGVLRAPEGWPDLLWRQRVSSRTAGHEETFEAVVQLRGGRLLVLGLSPWGGRAFQVEWAGGEVGFTSWMDRPPPFAPRYLLLDVERAFLLGATPPGAPPPEGELRLERDGEALLERWAGGRLQERRFRRLDGRPPGEVVVRYAGGWAPPEPPPLTTLENGWVGYTLEVETVSGQVLEPARER